MQQIDLDIQIQGIRALLIDQRKNSGSVLEWIREDFSNLIENNESSETLDPTLTITLTDQMEIPKLTFSFKTKMCRVYGWWRTRVCVYDRENKTALLQKTVGQNRKVFLKSDKEELLHEILYSYLLSFLGYELEEKGFVRLHAAGLSDTSKGIAFCLPQGGGKSGLSIKANHLSSDLKIFGDETILWKKGKLFPFPVRMAFAANTIDQLPVTVDSSNYRIFVRKNHISKVIIKIAPFKIASPIKAGEIYIAPGKFSRIWFMWAYFWGLGLSQMAEFNVTVLTLPHWLRVAVRRLKFIMFSLLKVRSLPCNYKYCLPQSFFQEPLISEKSGPKANPKRKIHEQGEIKKSEQLLQ